MDQTFQGLGADSRHSRASELHPGMGHSGRVTAVTVGPLGRFNSLETESSWGRSGFASIPKQRSSYLPTEVTPRKQNLELEMKRSTCLPLIPALSRNLASNLPLSRCRRSCLHFSKIVCCILRILYLPTNRGAAKSTSICNSLLHENLKWRPTSRLKRRTRDEASRQERPEANDGLEFPMSRRSFLSEDSRQTYITWRI